MRFVFTLLLLAGLAGSAYLSWRGHPEVNGPVHSLEDGTGFPTPKAP